MDKKTKSTTAKKAKSTSKKTKTHTSVKKDEKIQIKKSYLVFTAIAVLAVIAIILIVMGFGGKWKSNEIAAKIGNEIITVDELELGYSNLPDGYKEFVTRKDYLEQVMIPQKILSVAAKDVSSSKVKVVYDDYLLNTNMTESDVMELLAQQGMSLDDFMDLIKIQIHLNETIYADIQVTEEELIEFYDAQKEAFPDEELPPFEEIRTELEDFLLGQKSQDAQMKYVETLQTEMKVEVFYDEKSQPASTVPSQNLSKLEGTFNVLDDEEICMQDGKPIVRLFSTSTCPHCSWISSTFDSVVQEYVDSGDIVAYHWVLDTKDDTLTSVVEGDVPQTELDLFLKNNQQGYVPAFSFGCKYIRIGNGPDKDLANEEAEFRALIENLISN